MVSVLSTTYKVPEILICCTDNGASLTKPTTLTLGFPPNEPFLLLRLSSYLLCKYYLEGVV